MRGCSFLGMSRRLVPENPTAKQEEPQTMPSNGSNEDPDVERHEREHDQVGKPHPNPMNNGLGNATHKAVWRGSDELRIREHFNQHRDDEDEDQGQDVHAGASSGPTREEDLGVLPPEEGGVHHHPVHRVVVDVPGSWHRRWRTRRCSAFLHPCCSWDFLSLLFLSFCLPFCVFSISIICCSKGKEWGSTMPRTTLMTKKLFLYLLHIRLVS